MKTTSQSLSRLPKQNLDDSLDEENVDLKNLKRSRLMNKEIMDWAKKRSFSSIKKQYVHYPQDLKKMQEIKNVFLQIDKDGSRSLDKDEINEMFSKYDFYIDPDYLDQLFRIVDDDQDDALNWQEFKKCALNDNATRIFNYMMRKAREKANESKQDKKPIQVVWDITTLENLDDYEKYEQMMQEEEKQRLQVELEIKEEKPSLQLNYIPLRFLEVISYLSYLSDRDEILDKVNSTSERIQKFKAFQELFVCNQDYSQSYTSSKKQEMDLLRQRKSIAIEQKQRQRITIRNNNDLNSFLSRMTVVPFDANQKRQKNESKPIPLDYRERRQYQRSDAKPDEMSFSKLLMNKSEKKLNIPPHLISRETMRKQKVNIKDIDENISKVLEQNEKIKTEITQNQFVISDKIKQFVQKAKERYQLDNQNNNHSSMRNPIYQPSSLDYLKQQDRIPNNQRSRSRPESKSKERNNQKFIQEKYYAYQNSNRIREKLKTVDNINEDRSEFNDHEISQNTQNSNSLNFNEIPVPQECIQSINQMHKISESKLKKSLGFQNFQKIIGSSMRTQTPPKISIVYNKVLSSERKQNTTNQNEQFPQIHHPNNKTEQPAQTQFTNQKISQYLEKVNKAKLDPTLSAKRIFGSSQLIKRHLNQSVSRIKNQNIVKGDQMPLNQMRTLTRWVETVSVAQNENLQNQFIKQKNAMQQTDIIQNGSEISTKN